MRAFDEIKERIFQEYREKRPESLRLHEEAKKFLPGGDTRTATYFKPYPHFIAGGQGCTIWDVDGNRLLDFQNNYTSLIHGHGHPAIVEAVSRQIAKGSAFSAPIALQTKLAGILCERVASVDRVRFTNSGTEATMHAVRCARAFTGRTKILKLEGGYHGTSDIFEASVDPELHKAGTQDRPRPVPDSRGVPESSLEQVVIAPFNRMEATQRIIEENHRELAAFIIEPVMGSAGMIEPAEGYLEFVREITRRYGIMLIFDEVVTFRLERGGVQQRYGIRPDLTAFGKIIGGGMPIGAFGGREEIMKMYDPAAKIMYHSGTFNGNAISMAAGVAAMESYVNQEIERINSLGDSFRQGCRAVFQELGLNIRINGIGSLSNIVFSARDTVDYRDVAGSCEQFNVLLNMSLLNKGVFNAPRGMFCLSTPTLDEIEVTVERLREGLQEIKPAIQEDAPELLL